jgi:hypothetical protein
MIVFEQLPYFAASILALEDRINRSTSWVEIECLFSLIEAMELEG